MAKVKISYGPYLEEFREYAVKLVTEGSISAGRATERLSTTKLTREY